MRFLQMVLIGGLTALNLFGMALLCSPMASAGITDLDSWGTADVDYIRITSGGNIIPGTTIARCMGDSTHRWLGVYGNDAVGGTFTGNTTFTSANIGTIFCTSLSGNTTVNIPTAASAGQGALMRVIIACNNIGVNGNLTFNVTSGGNINGVDSVTVTNTAGSTGNVSAVNLFSTGSAWWASVSRK